MTDIISRLSDVVEAAEQFLSGDHWEGGTEGAHVGGHGVCIPLCEVDLRGVLSSLPPDWKERLEGLVEAAGSMLMRLDHYGFLTATDEYAELRRTLSSLKGEEG